MIPNRSDVKSCVVLTECSIGVVGDYREQSDALAGATAGATVGAMVGKSKQTKGSFSPIRPLQRLTSTAKTNKERQNDSTKPTTLSQKVGQVTGKVLGAKNQFRANINHRKEQLHDLPTTAQYAVMQGKEQLTKPARDFKEGMRQAKEKRQKTHADRQAKHRQTIADRRQALDKKNVPLLKRLLVMNDQSRMMSVNLHIKID